MSGSDTALPPGIGLRRATRDDNAAILAFVSKHVMRAGVAVRFDRSPDYFALHAAHSPQHETWLLLEGGRILGVGSLVLRPGYVGGRPETIAYFAELRVTPRRKIAGLWRRLLCERIAALHSRSRVRYGYCCIMRGNRLARASVLRARAEDELTFLRLRGYSNVSLLARKPWAGSANARVSIRRATAADSEALRSFVDSHAQQQHFGVVFDRETWRHRLENWPNFGIENFYLAYSASQKLVGCLAPWDSSPINRIIIGPLPARLSLARVAYNVLTPLSGKPAIAAGDGSRLPDVALTHVCVAGRDPEVFAALLDTAYGEITSTGRYATMSLCLYDGDPLAAAVQRYWHVAVPMDLYWLKLDRAAEALHLDAERLPGFEIYLV